MYREKAGSNLRGVGLGQGKEGESISKRKESSTTQGQITHLLPNACS